MGENIYVVIISKSGSHQDSGMVCTPSQGPWFLNDLEESCHIHRIRWNWLGLPRLLI